ncbi:MAG: TldD/PmbA family protein [Gemmatimonadaceae bacterium]|nr:TldD/PmbA family protein [Gemmatimonadaceae bacterium]
MTVSRRDFLKAGATVASAMALPRPLLVSFGGAPEPVPPIDDPRLAELARRALDAATGAGAAYADVRLTHTRTRGFRPAYTSDAESMVVGVRALVNGYWGFASGPVWSPDEMARLGREAVHQAKTNALGKTRVVELAPRPVVANGHWTMPVKVDAFDVSPFEVFDHLMGLQIFATRTRGVTVVLNQCSFTIQEKAFAASDGSYCTQRVYLGAGELVLDLEKKGQRTRGAIDLLTPAGIGWELYRDQPVREAVRALLAKLDEELALPVKPVDVGRYDMVFDPLSMAALLDTTLGRATELDRALGYEANAGGTSYLNAPLDMLGTYRAGAPSLTVTANRSEPGGAATVQWDDEGVAPDTFHVVKDGVLTDFQTTRESAAWLADYYAKRGLPLRSHGCANADSAINAPMQHTPNLVLVPGREAHGVDDLIAGLTTGIVLESASLSVDFQALNGMGRGKFFEVKQGKRVARIANAGILFRAPELWRGLTALGGAASARRYGMWANKGEPEQATCHSVTVVPAVFKQVTLIDPLRKA